MELLAALSLLFMLHRIQQATAFLAPSSSGRVGLDYRLQRAARAGAGGEGLAGVVRGRGLKRRIHGSHQRSIRYYTKSQLGRASKLFGSIGEAREEDEPGWIHDPWEKGVRFSLEVQQVLHKEQSGFQKIEVVSTPFHGRVLVLDGAFQCAERDEAGYHEMLAHVPLCRAGATQEGVEDKKKRALIIGGGDGGTAREILRHSDMESVDLVDIDKSVFDVARRFLPNIWRHPDSTDERYMAIDDDPRLTLHTKDGLAFVNDESVGQYDLIVVDASDPIGPGCALYSQSFYSALRRRLNKGGAVAVQGGSFWYLPLVFRTVYHGLKSAFPVVKPYECFTALYPGGVWNLHLATLGDDPSLVDEARAEALCSSSSKSKGRGLMFYSSARHSSAFAVPPVALRELHDKPAPTLEETTADLNAIMGYGGEGEELSQQQQQQQQQQKEQEEQSQDQEWWDTEVETALSGIIHQAVKESEEGCKPIAAFDADGTLWDVDATELLLAWVGKGGGEGRGGSEAGGGEEEGGEVSHWCGWRERHGDFERRYYNMLQEGRKAEAYGYAAQLFEGMSLTDIERLAKESFEVNVKHRILPEMVKLVTDLRAAGWRVCIVTASPRWVVEEGARALGVSLDDVLGIEVEVEEGQATDRLVMPLTLREGKVKALEARYSSPPALAAGNSLDDGPMLKMASHGLVVDPALSDELQTLAETQGWLRHSSSLLAAAARQNQVSAREGG